MDRTGLAAAGGVAAGFGFSTLIAHAGRAPSRQSIAAGEVTPRLDRATPGVVQISAKYTVAIPRPLYAVTTWSAVARVSMAALRFAPPGEIRFVLPQASRRSIAAGQVTPRLGLIAPRISIGPGSERVPP